MKKRHKKPNHSLPATNTFLDYKNPSTAILGPGNGIVAFDPGANGAFSLAWQENKEDEMKISVYPVNTCQPSFIYNLVSAKCKFHVIERVHAMPGQGSVSMFNFGAQYGMAKTVSEINTQSDLYYIGFVQPRSWQAFFEKKYNFEIPRGKEKQPERKKFLSQLAQEEGLSSTIMPLFGSYEDCADSYLILQWTLQFCFGITKE